MTAGEALSVASRISVLSNIIIIHFTSCYLHASSFPNGSLAVLIASTPADLTAARFLCDAGLGSFPLQEKNSPTQIDAVLSTVPDFSELS